MKDILLITPPFTQLNTPYPATAYLKGFLNTKEISAFQSDVGLEVILELFSSKTFEKIFELSAKKQTEFSENAQRIFALQEEYLHVLDSVILFLQGRNSTLARQICTDDFLPKASRFNQTDDLDFAFGEMGMQDKAKHLATLFLEDLSDFIIDTLDPDFGFSRYAERLGKSANSFDELYQKLQQKPSFIDEITLQILHQLIEKKHPKLVCFSVPFPGNLFSAFRGAQYLKKYFPEIKTTMGGGFPNTELRSITDVRVFEFFDYITLDDGELPIELLHKNITQATLIEAQYKRTFLLENGTVVYKDNSTQKDYKQLEIGTPDYSDLLLDKYISVIEIANPMHSLWSDGRWNKLTMAHGCYWGKCTFCDISLDYIKVYEPIAASLLVDRMEELIAQTGETGFHFVDEAAPPALMKALALEILKRKLIVTWWTNIRFEKNFTQDLCILLKKSGCIAVSGGLEVASDRLLKLIDKGVSVEQVAQVTHHFTQANIMVHSYLMYGFPTQTEQETVDSLEMVRQLFELGIIQSGFWHQFALTTHSPIGKTPSEYGITPHYQDISFANNDVDFTHNSGIKVEKFSQGLKKSLYNFMHNIGFELDLQQWFEFKVPKTTIPPFYIEDCLNKETDFKTKPSARILWLGSFPEVEEISKNKKGMEYKLLEMTFQSHNNSLTVSFPKEEGEWLLGYFNLLKPTDKAYTFSDLKTSFEENLEHFELFWHSKPMLKIKEFGLISV